MPFEADANARARKAGQPWTDDEDRFLVTYGPILGYGYIASHDLMRKPAEGNERIAYLRANAPERIAAIEAQEKAGDEAREAMFADAEEKAARRRDRKRQEGKPPTPTNDGTA